MDKKITSSVGILLIDIALVCGLFYGGWASNISLFWYWFLFILIAVLFISGKALEIKGERKKPVETALMYLGSFINVFGLFMTDHYITLLMYVISDIAVTVFRISRSELEGLNNG